MSRVNARPRGDVLLPRYLASYPSLVVSGLNAKLGDACEGDGSGRSAEGRQRGPPASVRRSDRVWLRWLEPE
eukprot:2401558-Pleurochrysis_carterae.AAC.1